MSIPWNRITCIVGMNGSGKTTLLRVLTGQESISSGSVTFKESRADYVMNSSGKPSETCAMGFCA